MFFFLNLYQQKNLIFFQGQVDKLKNALDNTHISIETAEQAVNDKNNQNVTKNDSNENSSKKQIIQSTNHEVNSCNKQITQYTEKIDAHNSSSMGMYIYINLIMHYFLLN